MKKVKIISAVIFTSLLCLSAQAFSASPAPDTANLKARQLIAKLSKKSPPKFSPRNAPLINFSLSPAEPKQNQNISLIAQADTTFSGRLLSLDLSLNGELRRDLIKPSTSLWLLPLGVQKEIRSHSASATVYIENAQDNLDIRAAITQLDTDIRNLTRSINAERDPAKRKTLMTQREEKTALKNELVEVLKKLRTRVGTQNFNFSIAANPDDSSLPTITNIQPKVGSVNGGTLLTITGTNFSSTASARVGGIASPSVSYINPTTIRVLTPNFSGQTGAKNIELRFTDGQGVVTNAISPAGFFAVANPSLPNLKPVAIATGGGKITLGETAQFDGSQSYDQNNDSLDFDWKFTATPSNSSFQPGASLAALQQTSFTPDVFGTYVLELIVKENATADFFESAASIVVVRVGAAPQPTANPISVGEGQSVSAPISANNPNEGQRTLFSISSAPAHGTAVISDAGLLTFTANDFYVGADALTVKAETTDGFAGFVNIPITITHVNHAPTIAPLSFSLRSGETITAQSVASDPDTANFGDTLAYSIASAPAHGSASINAAGLVSYTANPSFSGADSFSIRATDNGNLSADANISVSISINTAPAPTADAISLGTNGTKTSQVLANDPDANQSWTYAITTPPALGSASVSSTGLVAYTAGATTGNDSLVVTVTDSGQASGNVTIPITILAGLPPVIGTLSYNIRSEGLPVSIALSQSGTTDPNAGGTIASYRWQFGDGTAEFAPLGGSVTPGFSLHDYYTLGIFTATLTATNALGLSASKTISIDVQNNPMPVAKYSVNAISGATPFILNVNASASSSPGASIVQYRWNWGDGSAEQVSASPTASHTYSTPGSYSVRLRVIDSRNGFGEGTARIYAGVAAPSTGSAPAGNFTLLPRYSPLGGVVNFDASSSFDINPGASITGYEWNFTDFTSCPSNGCLASGVTSSYAYNFARTYFPYVQVMNSLGGSTISARRVITPYVLGIPPRAIFRNNGSNFNVTPSGAAPYVMNAGSGFSYDYDGSITSTSWNWGDFSACPSDGCTSSGTTASHTYANPGVYFPAMHIQDNDGNISSSVLTLTVNPAMRGVANAVSVLNEGGDNGDEEKQNLAGACSAGAAPACYQLGKIFQQEGNAYTAEQLFQRACNLGYSDACDELGGE